MKLAPRKSAIGAVLLSATMLAGCASTKPPQISYDNSVPPLPAISAAVTDERLKPLHVPPAWTVARGGQAASTATGRVENANAAARVQPRREGYFNAIQVYPWSEGALYQVYAAPGQITNIALEPGENLTGAGPIAAGDTARWIIGDTESGSGVARRVHVLVKPTRADIATNLVITTDRRTYMVELRSGEKPYMPAVSWSYPQPVGGGRQAIPATPVIPAVAARNYRYGLTGSSNPPWKPVAVYDDGRRVYVEFPRGIVQGEMPLAYLAGIIDRDGYISITRSERNGSYYFGPQIGISGTRRQPHDLAASIWGGTVSLYFPKNPNHRPQYQWSRQGAVAAVAIQEILPYLRVKNEHAQLALECWEYLKETREDDPFPWFSSDYNPLAVLNDMRETMIDMNQSKNKRRSKIS